MTLEKSMMLATGSAKFGPAYAGACAVKINSKSTIRIRIWHTCPSKHERPAIGRASRLLQYWKHQAFFGRPGFRADVRFMPFFGAVRVVRFAFALV